MHGGQGGIRVEVTDAAHDLMNHLSVARNYAALVQRHVDDPVLAGFLTELQGAVAKATQVAHQLQALGTESDG
jgi:hypothetical protein